MASMHARAFPLVLLVIALAGVTRFTAGVRTVDAVGLFASGALAGVSIIRLWTAMSSRRH